MTREQREQLKKLSTPALKAELRRARDEWDRLCAVANKQECVCFDLFVELRRREVKP